MSLRDQLHAIRDENGGRLTPHIVRETARPKNHPLHARVFDKAPKEAAEAYYLAKAYGLIQEARVVYRLPGQPSRSIRAYRPVPHEGGEVVYDPVEEIADDPFARELVLRDMERRWKALFDRYSEMEEFFQLVKQDVA